MADRIQLRRGTRANWESVNPVLAQGELGWDLTEEAFKVGDGVSTWMQLSYFAPGGGGGGADWGQIGGTLSDQTDLKNALDDKASATDLAGKENTLVAGTNITIDRTNPDAPVISSSGGGGGGGADWGQIGGDLADQTDLASALEDKVGQSSVRELLSADRTYYVRPEGSDTNDGLTDTDGGAFATIQHAVDVVCGLDCSVFQARIQIADGTYDQRVSLHPSLGALAPILEGNPDDPAAVNIISPGGHAISASAQASWAVGGVRLSAPTSGSCLSLSYFSRVNVTSPMVYGLCTARQITVFSGFLTILSPYTVDDAGLSHLHTALGGAIVCQNQTITIVGNPQFTQWAEGETGGLMTLYNNTYSGTARGKRYTLSLLSCINTYGAGATALPGNSNGTTVSGSFYA